MEILNRTNAPFGNGVWSVIDETIAEFLTKRLTLRSTVDFKGDYDFDTDAIPTKTLKKISSKNGTTVSLREPLKMLEVKKNFTISKDVIEDIKRGKVDFDDTSLKEAANALATEENNLILQGLNSANITGILADKTVESLEVANHKDLLQGVAKSLGIFNKNFVTGKIKLIASSNTLAKMYTESFEGISLKTKIDQILGENSIVINENIGDTQVLLLSQRGGDFEFYSGLDVAIGFEKEEKNSVELFAIETCAFRILGPEAAIVINIK